MYMCVHDYSGMLYRTRYISQFRCLSRSRLLKGYVWHNFMVNIFLFLKLLRMTQLPCIKQFVLGYRLKIIIAMTNNLTFNLKIRITTFDPNTTFCPFSNIEIGELTLSQFRYYLYNSFSFLNYILPKLPLVPQHVQATCSLNFSGSGSRSGSRFVSKWIFSEHFPIICSRKLDLCIYPSTW